MPNLEGKKIIITGASKGLGQVSAVTLASLGAQLVLMARSRDKLEEVRKSCQKAEKHLGLSVDLTDLGCLKDAIRKAKEHLGAVDCVLHVAGGGLGLRDPLLGLEDLQRLFFLNVGVASSINRLVVPDMVKQGGGNLVHVGSVVSNEGVASVGYNTVKAALAAYVRSLGVELACHNIIATGILPGGFQAPGNSMERLAATKPEVYRQFIAERLPRKKMGDAKELIPMILLLCSDEASMMSGCMVPIDAGEGRSYVL